MRSIDRFDVPTEKRFPDTVSILVDLSVPSASRGIGFKFGITPEEAFNLLIAAATERTGSAPFHFEEEVRGTEAPNGESFEGTLGGKFVDLLADYPPDLAADLQQRWSAGIRRLIEERYPPRPPRRKTGSDRLQSIIIAAAISVVVLPLLAINMLRPSFRRERAANRKKRLENAAKPKPPGKDDECLIPQLIELFRTARARGEAVRYEWHL